MIYPKPLAKRIKIVAGMCLRLEKTDDLCKEIGIDATGRHDTAARIFKRVTGTSMTRYRENARRLKR